MGQGERGVIPTRRLEEVPIVFEEEYEPDMKKRVVTKSPEIKRPVRKPQCPLHTGKDMEFDPVEQKWVCAVNTCTLVRRPKRAEGDVVAGKGAVNLRIVLLPNSRIRVVLISDDNVMLDVTDMMSEFVVEKIRKNIEPEMVEAALSGQDSVVVSIKTRLTIMFERVNITNLVLLREENK